MSDDTDDTSNTRWVLRSLRERSRTKALLEREVREAKAVSLAALTIANAISSDHKVMFFGNGGSAADAQHLAAELVGRLGADRAALAAIALTTDSSTLTAIGNDYGFDQVFARQLLALGRPGDVAVAISTSGRSPNVLQAINVARRMGIQTIGLTSRRGEELAARCDLAIVVPTQETSITQEMHITIGHLICVLVEHRVCGVTLDDVPPIDKRVTLSALLSLRHRYRERGEVVVFTNGCFDLLHEGHIASLNAAKRCGDVLVVGVNADDQVRTSKGPGRPIRSLEERCAVLTTVDVVDHVVSFSEPTPTDLLARLQPDVHCKGDKDVSVPRLLPEYETVTAYGGIVKLLPSVPGRSTTETIRKIGVVTYAQRKERS